MGMIALPAMAKGNYNKQLSAGVICAADPVSVGDLFAGAFIPGLLLVCLYLVYVFIISIVRPASCLPVRAAQIEVLSDNLTLKEILVALVALDADCFGFSLYYDFLKKLTES